MEWLKWLLKFSFYKYVGIAFMALGPLFFMYRYIYLHVHIYEVLIGGGLTFATGVIIWLLSFDPYR